MLYKRIILLIDYPKKSSQNKHIKTNKQATLNGHGIFVKKYIALFNNICNGKRRGFGFEREWAWEDFEKRREDWDWYKHHTHV